MHSGMLQRVLGVWLLQKLPYLWEFAGGQYASPDSCVNWVDRRAVNADEDSPWLAVWYWVVVDKAKYLRSCANMGQSSSFVPINSQRV